MITYVPYRATDTGALVEFLTTSTWPFHTDPTLDHGVVAGRVAAGEFDTGVSQQCWWIFAESTRVGFVRLFDLADPTAMFDLRIAAHCRARGYGTAAVSWLTGHLFGQRAALRRIEATTRHDNQAMRRALRRCGYAKEAHYRQAWEDPDGRAHDAVGYAILRSDWATGTVTTVDWADEADP